VVGLSQTSEDSLFRHLLPASPASTQPSAAHSVPSPRTAFIAPPLKDARRLPACRGHLRCDTRDLASTAPVFAALSDFMIPQVAKSD
jgi:hypothetical protein